MEIIVMTLLVCAGNAKQPNILGQMIAEAREIRENQSYRNNASTSAAAAAAGAKHNHAEESVSETCLKLDRIGIT
jgi:serine/threonine kinase 3